MGLCRPMAITGDAKQATGEGLSSPVETGLTGPVATALISSAVASHHGFIYIYIYSKTSEKGHIGNEPFVPCREVVLFLKCIITMYFVHIFSF